MKTGAEIVAAGSTCPTGPTKYTAKTLDTLLAAIADGLTIIQACRAARISRQCFDNWRDRFPEFTEALEQAREESRRKALAIIKEAALNGDYNAAVQFLRFSFHPDYCKPDTRVQVTNQTGIQLVCDEATRARLIELRKEILKPRANTIEADTLPVVTAQPVITEIELDAPEAVESEAERTMREMQNQQIAESVAQQEEPESCTDPWGHNHPAITRLGMGPK